MAGELNQTRAEPAQNAGSALSAHEAQIAGLDRDYRPKRDRRDPFEIWRDEQRAADRQDEVEQPMRIDLSPGRAAERMLAIDRMLDARFADPFDQAEFDQAAEELVALNRRLYLEQTAELEAAAGVIPTTFEGCVAVLDLASRIINAYRTNQLELA